MLNLLGAWGEQTVTNNSLVLVLLTVYLIYCLSRFIDLLIFILMNRIRDKGEERSK